ncbi:E7 protein [Deltapapillomavirus 5]|uniref:Protein E7 n=1 Tax=Deltapapillomavirus 5 TaxID=1175853 RepID=A0A0S2KP74_9PAPI|nr:E7 protein [Deltapapillomavirus 5]
MVHGPLTSKVLPSDESPVPSCLTLYLEPVKAAKEKNTCSRTVETEQNTCSLGSLHPTRPPPKPPRRKVYYVGVTCCNCFKKLDFAVKTSRTSIDSLHSLLLGDLDLLCALCEGKSRDG